MATANCNPTVNDVTCTVNVREDVARARDKILVNRLVCRSIIGVERWEREKQQHVIISLTLWGDITKAGTADLVEYSHHYGLCSSGVAKFSENSRFKSVEALATAIAQLVVTRFGVAKVTVDVSKPAALLYAKAAGVCICRSALDYPEAYQRFFISQTGLPDESQSVPLLDPNECKALPHDDDCVRIVDLQLRCIIGVNPWERDVTQPVIVNLAMYVDVGYARWSDTVAHSVNYRKVAGWVVKHVEKSKFKTLEALALSIVKGVVVDLAVPRATVRTEKPCALLMAESSGVEVTRTAADFC